MVKKRRSLLGPVLYGTIFVLVVPCILLAWTVLLDRSIHWPVFNSPLLAASSILGGVLLLLKGMLDLLHFGHGLPMNAYPPKQFVTQGVYAWFSHPIYLGAALLSAGTALWLHSSGGLYIVTPMLLLMILSFVSGYELPALKQRFGSGISQYRPLFSLPLSAEHQTTWLKKWALLLRVYLPWMLVGYFVDVARGTQSSRRAFLILLDVQQWHQWTSMFWVLPYLALAVLLLVARTDKGLRHSAIAGTVATVVGLYGYVILPALGVPVNGSDWTLLLVSIAVLLIAINYRRLWAALQRVSEWIANSRHDWVMAGGRFRVINHSLYSGLGGAVAAGMLCYIVGNPLAVLMLLLCALLGAAGFAQVLWGSPVLSRPFGYWGAVLGGGVGVLVVSLCFAIPLTTIAVAAVLCAPFAQAIGRLRCLAQGCCHGVVTTQALGIRIWHPQSRVVAISGLKGATILNTQLYSILFNVPLGFLLWSMWLSQSVSSSLIIGCYFMLTGIERFTEDAYRGEKQTRSSKGLRENQWIALGAVLLGIGMTMLPTALPVQPSGPAPLTLVVGALVGGVLTAFAMSMDFPQAPWRFSRLSG